MKKVMLLPALTLFIITVACGQGDKSKRASPPAKASATTNKGVMVTIDYSQPAVKGRTIGKDVEPMAGKVWRTGANEATVFEVNKDVKVEGKALPAGKYSLYSINNGDDWTIIFNKKWNQWGTEYNEGDDALRVNVKGKKASAFTERLTFNVNKEGKVSMMWGDKEFDFNVQ